MIILNCDQHRNLSFVDKKYRILQGEHKFDVIKINMPESIDGVDNMQGVSIKMHFVSGNEHIDRQVVLENGYISTDIDYTLTEKSKRWLLYLAFYVNVDGEIEIGKTNAIAIQVNKLPYSDTLAKEYKEPEIVLIKGDKGDKGDPGEDGKSAYEIAVEHGYEGTEEEWLSEMKDYNELDNKPQINDRTLSGNKSADDLGLQDKLTAGENITISEEGVISATGGTDDYNDLTNKPKFNGVDFEGEVIFGGGLDYRPLSDYYYLSVNVNDVLNKIYSISDNPSGSGSMFGFQNASNIYGFLPTNDSGVLFKFRDEYYHESAQRILQHYIFFPSVGNKIYLRTDSKVYGEEPIIGQWNEVGGSSIVSAVVNQNGTITFTMSDGTTFTTSGASVIGPQGDDYILTPQDKSDIADVVLRELPNADTMSF